jgi:hypothetical protein
VVALRLPLRVAQRCYRDLRVAQNGTAWDSCDERGGLQLAQRAAQLEGVGVVAFAARPACSFDGGEVAEYVRPRRAAVPP